MLQNICSPPILFFGLGAVATFVNSNLELPPPLPKLFSLYLLLCIGFTGGVELEKVGLQLQVFLVLLAALAMALLVPCIAFPVLRRKLDEHNSAAVAASYGSISAVTFITAQSFLSLTGVEFDGYMVAALALMETPAIVVGLSLVHTKTNGKYSTSAYLLKTLTDESVLLLGGSFGIGFTSSKFSAQGVEKMEVFTKQLFYGALCFFLLDMGMLAAKQIREFKDAGSFLILFAIFAPILNATVGIGISWLLALSKGNALLFAVLCGSASYIAVPAAMREGVPKAKPSLYLGTSLGVTFPFNITVGIPLYMSIIQAILK